MSAQPLPAHDLEADAATIFQAQQDVKFLCAERDELTAQIAAQYRIIEDSGYALRLHLSETKATEARIGGFEVAVKYDEEKPRVAYPIFDGSTGEIVSIIPSAITTRLVVRKAKP